MNKATEAENSRLGEKLDQIISVIREGKRFFLAGHVNPDGDTVGCMLAISSVLKRLGKKTYLFSNDPIPENLDFLSGINKIKIKKIPKSRFDAMILLECSTLNRAGDLWDLRKRTGRTVNIDHHRTAANFGNVNLVDSSFSSTAEIVFRLFDRMGVKINQKEARYLYVGMVTDTGRFQFPSTNQGTHLAAAALLETGFNFANVNKLLYSTKTYPAVKVLGRALESLKLEENGKVAYICLKRTDFSDFNASLEHSENIINYGMMVPGVKISVLFREEPQQISVTFRSKGKVDVSLLAKSMGGGGHKYAAGCRIALSLDAAIAKVKDSVVQIEK